MMNHAIDKMKESVEWKNFLPVKVAKLNDNIEIISTDRPIRCFLSVNIDSILCNCPKSHSWKIEKVLDDWKPRFKVNDIVRKGTIVAIIACANEKETNPDNFGYRMTIVGHTPPKWNEWTKDDEHWISAEDEKNWSKIGEVTMDVENGDV